MNELSRINRKKNQILHDLKAVQSHLDRLYEDVEELCAMRRQQKEDDDGDNHKYSECNKCELGGVIGSGGICSACGERSDKADTDA